MIVEPKCFKRGCTHFKGVKWLGDQESTEVVYCTAYPRGIPYEIAYGDDKHMLLRGDEKVPVTYEKEE